MKTKYYLFVMVGLLLLSCEEFENMDCSHIVSHNISHKTTSVDLWEKGRIPYEFAPDFPHDKELLVLFAMEKWESQTKAIDFVPRNNEPEYLLINWSEGTSCNATLGAGNPCKVNFSDYCTYPRTYYHELGHVLGLTHEHQRPRSREYGYITFNDSSYDLVFDSLGLKTSKSLKSQMYNTDKVNFSNLTLKYSSLNLDRNSVMAYGSQLNNAKGNIHQLLVRHNKYIYQLADCSTLLPNEHISTGDVNKINKIYNKRFTLLNKTERSLIINVYANLDPFPYELILEPNKSHFFNTSDDNRSFLLNQGDTINKLNYITFSGSEFSNSIQFEDDLIAFEHGVYSEVLARDYINNTPKNIYFGNPITLHQGLDMLGPQTISMNYASSSSYPTSLVFEVY